MSLGTLQRDGAAAGSTTRSAAASRATPSTRTGPCRTSRRCSTTTRCSPAHICTAGRFRARSACATSAARRSTGRCARCAAPRAASAPRSTPTQRASRASSTCGRCRAARRARSGTRRRRDRVISARPSAETSSTDRMCSRPAAQRPTDLAEIRAELYDARSARVRPGLDDKRLTSWNALMISALAEAGAVLERRDYSRPRPRAGCSCSSIFATATVVCCAPGRTARGRLGAYLEDHAFLLAALITLYETTFDPRWYHEAVALADSIIERFSDPELGGFFTTPTDHEQLDCPAQGSRGLADPVRAARPPHSRCCGLRCSPARASTSAMRSACSACCSRSPVRHPHAFGHLLQAADFYLAPVREVAIVGPSPEPLLRVVRSQFRAAYGARRRRRGTACRCSRDESRSTGRRRVRVRALRLPGAGHDAEALAAESARRCRNAAAAAATISRSGDGSAEQDEDRRSPVASAVAADEEDGCGPGGYESG